MAEYSPLFNDPNFALDIRNFELSGGEVSRKWDIAKSAVNKWRRRVKDGLPLPGEDTFAGSSTIGSGESELHKPDGSWDAVKFSSQPWGHEDFRNFIRECGQDPDTVSFTWGWTSNPSGGFWNKLNNVRPIIESKQESGPAWPVITPGPQFLVPTIKRTAKATKWSTAILIADTQIGYRFVEGQDPDPFHDEAAMNVALQIIDAEDPDQTVVMGDIMDLPSQGKFSQEAGFARSTQAGIDRTTVFGAELRGATSGKIIYIEGNHDKRMQNFVEANAVAAFGLRRGDMPDSMPVMSIPYLLRLDEFGIIYKDAYPTSHWWINDKLRCEHGTKSNSSGSTAAQYMNETPHISRAHGHTHRLEAQSKTTFDRAGKLRNMAINPGCLCRVDGAVPSSNGSISIDGKAATYFENWQQGLVVVRYREGDEFFVDGLVQIDDGRTMYGGQEFEASI